MKKQSASKPTKAPAPLKTAERCLNMKDGDPWKFRFDHACLYELSQTGQSMNEFLKEMSLGMATGKVDLLYDFAWFMTASHRAECDIDISPALFRARLPVGELGKVGELVGGILADVFPDAFGEKDAKSGNDENENPQET